VAPGAPQLYSLGHSVDVGGSKRLNFECQGSHLHFDPSMYLEGQFRVSQVRSSMVGTHGQIGKDILGKFIRMMFESAFKDCK
jgi:hypothetical protein